MFYGQQPVIFCPFSKVQKNGDYRLIYREPLMIKTLCWTFLKSTPNCNEVFDFYHQFILYYVIKLILSKKIDNIIEIFQKRPHISSIDPLSVKMPPKSDLFAFSSFRSAFIHGAFLIKMNAPFFRCQNPKPWQALSCIL